MYINESIYILYTYILCNMYIIVNVKSHTVYGYFNIYTPLADFSSFVCVFNIVLLSLGYFVLSIV